MMNRRDLYAALVQLVIHAESISWNRFYNFLMANSILVLAWATIYASQDRFVLTSFVLSVICAVGGGSGIVWARLGTRSREYVQKHIEQAVELEKDQKTWEEETAETWKPFTAAKAISDKAEWYTTSRAVLKWGPVVFAVFYVILLFASWLRLCSSRGGTYP